MASLGILTLHGMGKTEEGYANDLFDEIDELLGDDLAGHIKTASVFYQGILQDNQSEYLKRVKRRLRWDNLREFLLYGFSDAASLESRKEGVSSPYYQAQEIILNTLKNLYSRLEGPDRRVIVIAQSLGGQVISNYLWDATKDGTVPDGVWSQPQVFESAEEEEFCRGKKTVRLLTTGCNIPIFVAGFNRQDIKPIRKIHPKFEWHNFYDKDDVLGWPLRDLSDDYAQRVKDHSMNAGLLSGFTPLSHKHYWRDRDFLKPLITHIKRSL